MNEASISDANAVWRSLIDACEEERKEVRGEDRAEDGEKGSGDQAGCEARAKGGKGAGEEARGKGSQGSEAGCGSIEVRPGGCALVEEAHLMRIFPGVAATTTAGRDTAGSRRNR